MPFASADSVHHAIAKVVAKASKSGPISLKIAEIAEGYLYSDTAEYRSEEVYLPFAKMAAGHKKISKADRARFAHQVKQMETSGLGATVPDLEIIRPDGSKGTLAEANSGSVLLFFNEPDCMDCTMARLRLSTDINARELIANGGLTIVSIYPGDPDDTWREAVASYPTDWLVCAMPDADLYFDLRDTPELIFLNKKHKVLAKGYPVDHYLNAFRVANTPAR